MVDKQDQNNGWFLNNGLFKTLMKSGAIKVFSVGIVFLTGVLLSRSLGPENYGIYTYAYTIAMLVSLLISGGLSTLLLRTVAQYQLQEKWAYIKGIKRRAYQLVLLGSLILGAVLAAYFVTIDYRLVKCTHYISLLLIPIVSLAAVRTSILRGFNKPLWGQLPDDVVRPGLCLALLLVVYSTDELSPVLAMAMYAIAGFVALLVGQYFLNKYTPLAILSVRGCYEDRKWIKQMLPFTLIAGIQMLNSQLDVLMIGAILRPVEVGLYQVAAQVVVLIGFPLLIVNYVLTPKFAQYFISNELMEMQKIIVGAAKIILLISIPTVLFFVLLGERFVDVVFGAAYSGAYTPLLILMLGQVVNAWIGSVGVLLNMAGYELLAAKGLGASLLVNITLNYFLIPSMGINGAAVATSLTLVVWNLYMSKILWDKKQIKAGVFSLLIPEKRTIC